MLLAASMLLAMGLTTAQATPFRSPSPTNTIHEPLITQNDAPAALPATVEREGVPIAWIIGLLLLLFVPAITFFAIRRRP